jgi:hypothetical protein
MSWWRGENFDGPLSEQEYLILDTYEAEVERGIVHTLIWDRRMSQLVELRQKERESDPSPIGTRWDR